MKPPLFIVGCPRSGTTLLYHTLLSSGKFAVYMAETDVFYRIAPAFGDFRLLSTRRKLMDVWLSSDYFKRCGLSREPLRTRILAECSNPGDFLRVVMETVTDHQGLNRWADNTPLHILYIREIKRFFPDAQFVHVVRDGRDVAASLSRLGWTSPLFWDRRHRLAVSGLYWKWLVSKGREYGRALRSQDYLELHYEELVKHPRESLSRLSSFTGETLDYERIKNHPLGVMAKPNSSFASSGSDFTPLNRWQRLPREDVSRLTALLGPLLSDLGYPVLEPDKSDWISDRLRVFYPAYFQLRQLARRSLLSRLFVKGSLQKGDLDKEDSRWEAIRAAHCISQQDVASLDSVDDERRGPRHARNRQAENIVLK